MRGAVSAREMFYDETGRVMGGAATGTYHGHGSCAPHHHQPNLGHVQHQLHQHQLIGEHFGPVPLPTLRNAVQSFGGGFGGINTGGMSGAPGLGSAGQHFAQDMLQPLPTLTNGFDTSGGDTKSAIEFSISWQQPEAPRSTFPCGSGTGPFEVPPATAVPHGVPAKPRPMPSAGAAASPTNTAHPAVCKTRHCTRAPEELLHTAVGVGVGVGGQKQRPHKAGSSLHNHSLYTRVPPAAGTRATSRDFSAAGDSAPPPPPLRIPPRKKRPTAAMGAQRPPAPNNVMLMTVQEFNAWRKEPANIRVYGGDRASVKLLRSQRRRFKNMHHSRNGRLRKKADERKRAAAAAAAATPTRKGRKTTDAA